MGCVILVCLLYMDKSANTQTFNIQCGRKLIGNGVEVDPLVGEVLRPLDSFNSLEGFALQQFCWWSVEFLMHRRLLIVKENNNYIFKKALFLFSAALFFKFFD